MPRTNITDFKGDPLRGRENWSTWSAGTMMSLRGESVDYTIETPKPRSPEQYDENDDADADAIRNATIEFLQERKEEPEVGYSAQKVKGNKFRWMAARQAECDKWDSDNTIALSIIYHSCARHVAGMIQHEELAAVAWKTLEACYSISGFLLVLEQARLISQLTSGQGQPENLREYSENIKAAKCRLTRAGIILDDNDWAALFINGLGNRFRLLRREVATRTSMTLDDAISLAFVE